MHSQREKRSERKRSDDDLSRPDDGYGPLLQRDYWAVLRGCRLSCHDVASLVRNTFADLAPESFVHFECGDSRRLEKGDEIKVGIRPGHRTAVRVLHADEHSLTLGTLKGHPECGRITFGSYPNESGDIVFHIRSRARTSSLVRHVGFLALGDSMQACTWTDFIDRLAHMVGDGVVDAIHVQTREVEENEEVLAMNTPTFTAQEE